MKKFKKSFVIIFWLVLMVVTSNIGIVSALFDGKSEENQTVSADSYMTTEEYHTVVRVNEDNTYDVQENIRTSFSEHRHGIYRYIPYKGSIVTGIEDGVVDQVPYRARITLKDSNITVSEDNENNNKVFRFGDEEDYVLDGQYNFSYHVKPVTQYGYTNAYYNVFPTGWQNEIPAGSQFEVEFPKDFPHEILALYYGSFGEMKDAQEILELTWNQNTLTGTLKENLPVGNGVTFYAPMPEGYFTNVPSADYFSIIIICLSVAAAVIAGVLFYRFGRDEKIYPSIQYYPPEGLDSAAVGYIIDGAAEDKDIVSLFVYWADKGYIKIEENEKGEITFIKCKDMDKNAPKYAKTVFDGIFGAKGEKDKQVNLSSLKYKFAPKMEKAKKQLKQDLDQRGGGGIYTRQSRTSQMITGLLSAALLFVFMLVVGYYASGIGMYIWGGIFFVCYLISMFFLCDSVNKWYAKSNASQRRNLGIGFIVCAVGLVGFTVSYLIRVYNGTVFRFIVPLAIVLAATGFTLFTTVFMKKRTPQCVEWMGYLIGLRDFIQTAELERMEVLAAENPKWFYHIMPYAYVFGLSDVWMKKFEGIAVPAPDWYRNTTGRMDYFDFYIFHRSMMHNLNTVSTTLSTPKPQEASSGGSGGGFGGGGGGFSGGGFGGGGGGSW